MHLYLKFLKVDFTCIQKCQWKLTLIKLYSVSGFDCLIRGIILTPKKDIPSTTVGIKNVVEVENNAAHEAEAVKRLFVFDSFLQFSMTKCYFIDSNQCKLSRGFSISASFCDQGMTNSATKARKSCNLAALIDRIEPCHLANTGELCFI